MQTQSSNLFIMPKTSLDLPIGMVRKRLRVCGYSTLLDPEGEKGEVLKMQMELPDMPIETICLIQPDPGRPEFFFRVRRERGSVYEVYEVYGGGWWYGVDFFKPPPFGSLEKPKTRKYMVERMGEALNLLTAFCHKGDDALRPYERKRIKIVDGS